MQKSSLLRGLHASAEVSLNMAQGDRITLQPFGKELSSWLQDCGLPQCDLRDCSPCAPSSQACPAHNIQTTLHLAHLYTCSASSCCISRSLQLRWRHLQVMASLLRVLLSLGSTESRWTTLGFRCIACLSLCTHVSAKHGCRDHPRSGIPRTSTYTVLWD